MRSIMRLFFCYRQLVAVALRGQPERKHDRTRGFASTVGRPRRTPVA